MKENELEKLRYPIGKFQNPTEITDAIRNEWIAILEALPQKITELVKPLSDAQLETPYRPGGWTVRQLVHHIADSHHNSYTRFKWALTESNPTIKAYNEKEWAKLFDSQSAPIAHSLEHLSVVHKKLVYLLKGLNKAQLQRTFVHPDDNYQSTIEENIGRYAWHGSHHFAQLENLIQNKNW